MNLFTRLLVATPLALAACNAESSTPGPSDAAADMAQRDAFDPDAAADVEQDATVDVAPDALDPCDDPEFWPISGEPCDPSCRTRERDFVYVDDAGVFLGTCPQLAECVYTGDGDQWRVYEFCSSDAG